MPVLHRPVGVRRAGDRRPVDASTHQRVGDEVDLAEAPGLGVVVDGAAADSGGQVVDVADEGARPVAGLEAEGSRLQPRVLIDRVLHHRVRGLVVGELVAHLGGVAAEPGEVVASLLQDEHRVLAAPGQKSRNRAPGGAAADDDRPRHQRALRVLTPARRATEA